MSKSSPYKNGSMIQFVHGMIPKTDQHLDSVQVSTPRLLVVLSGLVVNSWYIVQAIPSSIVIDEFAMFPTQNS